MKRAVLILVLLTVVVALPPLYSQWSESRRIKQIQEVKQQARTVFGDQVETVLSELESGEPPSVVILYTGGTESHLEPCGCYQEQSGGLPRRAHVVDQIRQNGFPTLLVDAGNIFDGKEQIDAKRCEVNLKAMSTMEYDAVALSESDLAYDKAYLSRQRTVATFPFLAPDAARDDFTQPFIMTQTEQHAIGFVVGEACEEVVSQADIVVALGEPENPEHIDVVIRPDEIETTVSEDGRLYVGSKHEGKTLGVLAFWMDTSRKLTRHYTAELALTGDVGESESVRQLLTDFYRDVAAESPSQDARLFTEQLLEQQPKNGYVSATACQRCHEQEYQQWSATRHAFAYETLLKKERYFDAGCVSCHTTGFGYQTGFQIGDSNSTLKGVQCETCHGPGKQHIGNPKKSNIRSGADTSLCLQCHDTKHSPGFEEVVALHRKDVDHSRAPMNLEELLASRIARVGKPTLELFVMSYCPYGVQAEEKIIPIVKKFGDVIDFKLQFIAQEKENPSAQDITPFTSLHGYPEVAENIRQLLIAQEYPDKYLDYILCRGKKLDKSWEDCAEKLGIDAAKIQALFDAPEAEQLFRENIARAEALGIKASPTILVDGHKFRANQLLRASGTPCQ
ncbi:thioredoxin domain-containing protein [Candidatus Poribacteria bacterium]|nr:thioredoxin domain-containing protein [Candidatus Poribacteria bacterium]MYH82732.1 thioredoxin domain-containing protein [Candidatus Poribacteria bacterium]MYK95681.1 thioredoxin domain-containing protein [Candidatus Poribacteria bacterium]